MSNSVSIGSDPTNRISDRLPESQPFILAGNVRDGVKFFSHQTPSATVTGVKNFSHQTDQEPPLDQAKSSSAIAQVDPATNPYLLAPSEVKAIWQQQTAIPGYAVCLSSFFTGLDADEVDLIDFICQLKPEFRFGRRVDWEIIKKLFAQDSGLGEPYVMQVIRDLESKGLFARDGEMLFLVWQLKVGQFVPDGAKVPKPKPKPKPQAKEGSKSGPGKKKKPKTPNKKSAKQVILEKQSRCIYCGGKPQEPTIDHIVPQSMGGTNQPHNMGLSCQLCNYAKADRTPEQWALSILQYRNRMNQKPTRFVDIVIRHRHTLAKTGQRFGNAITAIVVTCLALVFLRNGGAR